MSDSMSGAVSEIASEVKDAVGEMIEQGVQSVTATPLTPQQIQQKQQQDQNELKEVRRKVEFYKKLSLEQGKVRQVNQQKEQQQVQEKKVEKMQVTQSQKKPGVELPEEIARTRQEIGKGHGVGG